MKTAMLGFLAETSIHPGTGRSMGVVDLPVAREAATDYPVLVGSSLKGALKDKAERIEETNEANSAEGRIDVEKCFGKQGHAGDLLVSDARLLLLPVRSLTTSFRWATCPHLLERYRRDLARAGSELRPKVPSVQLGSVLSTGNDILFLEERQFTIRGAPDEGLVKAIEPLVLHQNTRGSISSRIAVLHDDDFAWFARYSLAIQARNFLDDKTKKSKNLWYEESLPPDTVMYALVTARGADALEALGTLFQERDPYLQAGGNETVGQGWFAISLRCGTAGGEV